MHYDIVLISPPSPYLITQNSFPRLGIRYLSAILKQHGYKPLVVDLALGETIPAAPIYGITVSSPDVIIAEQTLKLLKKLHPDSHFVAGGPHAIVMPDDLLRRGFDQVVASEGELVILDIMNGNRDKLITREPVQNLDTIPFPDREYNIAQKYKWMMDGLSTANIFTSRGCPYSCSFCCRGGSFGSKVRYRSAQDVISEIMELKSQYKYKAVMFYDDELLLNIERDKEIFIALSVLEMPYRILTRSNFINDATCKILKDTGCRELFLGIESGSQQILNNIKKRTTIDMNKAAIALLKHYGIRVKTGFIIGLPGETLQTIQDTEKFIEETQPDDLDFTILTVYPGSHIYAHPESYDCSFGNYYHHYKGPDNNYIVTVSTSSLNGKQILSERNRLEAKFQPGYVEKWKKAHS